MQINLFIGKVCHDNKAVEDISVNNHNKFMFMPSASKYLFRF